MCQLLLSGALLCHGALGFTATLDTVAERRYNAGWSIAVDPAQYHALIGLEDCALLGRVGWLFTGNTGRRVLVADCRNRAHSWPMGYLGDVNLPGLNCQKGILILKNSNGPHQ